MDPESIAVLIAEYLDNRDDIASAKAYKAIIEVVTQGTSRFIVVVNPA